MRITIYHNNEIIREFTTEQILRSLMHYAPAFVRGEKFSTVCQQENDSMPSTLSDIVTVSHIYRYHVPEQTL